MMKRIYQVDLSALMRIYETNYSRLLKLLPSNNDVGERRIFDIQGTHFCLDIVESTRYTTLLDILQQGDIPDYLRPQLRVRMYHDARVAEVCASQQICRIQPRYDYPNAKMHQRNEKHQINAFLSDWLAYCLRFGISKQNIIF